MLVSREYTCCKSELIISLSDILLWSSQTQMTRMVDDFKIVPIFCNLMSSNFQHTVQIADHILWTIFNLLDAEDSYITMFLSFGGLAKLLRMKHLYDNDDDNDDIAGLIIETYDLTNRAKIIASAA